MPKIVVLGGGESGCGAAVLARVKGFDVFLSDMGVIAPKYEALLAEWNVPYEEGQHTAGRILDADRVVKSPGIPDKAPMMKAVRERGIPVVSEIEFAAPYTSARTICVTGSNGKTTTTTLTYEILRRAGANVALGGNIGRSFALSVATERRDWYVIELSSFQLDGCYDFRADIGVLTNITPDHLDRYEYRLQNYVDSKFRILRNRRPPDCFIYCADDPLTLENLPKHPLSMRTLPFSVRRGDCAAVLRDGTIRAEAAGRRLEIPVSELRIKGMHNTYDAMAAVLAALSAGIEPDAILPTLRSFEGVEHRLEPCGEIDGVEYVNDSKATNVDSVWYALESMTRPVVWIAGGTDKGNDYSRLYDLAGAKVKALVCMGVDNEKLIRAFDGRIPRIEDTHSLDDAMAAARAAASSGDTVLRFAGLRELRPVQELRGTGASVQGVGGDALAEAPLTTAVPGLAFRRREGRRDEMSGSCGRGEFSASGASRRSGRDVVRRSGIPERGLRSCVFVRAVSRYGRGQRPCRGRA